jgi:hypothetical protein
MARFCTVAGKALMDVDDVALLLLDHQTDLSDREDVTVAELGPMSLRLLSCYAAEATDYYDGLCSRQANGPDMKVPGGAGRLRHARAR